MRVLVVLAASLAATTCGAATTGERDVDPESARVGDPPLIVERPAEPIGERRDLGPLLGGEVVVRTPTPARWASRVGFSRHYLLTREHAIWGSIYGSAVLRLHVDGRAEACFAARETSASSMSEYQSRDGLDHHDSSTDTSVVGMSGVWQREGEGPGVSVRFDRTSWRTCAVDPEQAPSEQPAMRCFAFAATSAVPSDALLCSVPEALDVASKLSLLIGDSPRAGAWAYRHDPTGHGEPPPADAQPWLLLGGEPGLELSLEDSDRDEMPPTIVVAEVGDPVAPRDP
ncbi:hypothetical protein ACNOYE_14390 [Nannocystaceae bacterium ST9]